MILCLQVIYFLFVFVLTLFIHYYFCIIPNSWCKPQNLIKQSFHNEDEDAILWINLSFHYIPDVIFWMHNKNVIYSVKSGYRVAYQLAKEADCVEASKEVFSQEVWRKIWRLRVPNKSKVFGRRACKEILPTSVSLHRRKVIADVVCPICILPTETCLHSLWGCGAARDVWASSLPHL